MGGRVPLWVVPSLKLLSETRRVTRSMYKLRDPADKSKWTFRGGNGTAIARTLESPGGALPQPTSTDEIVSGRKRKPIASSLPSRRSPRLQLEQSAPLSTGNAQPESNTQSDHETGQSPPPSLLACVPATLSHSAFESQEETSRSLPREGIVVLFTDVYCFSAVYWQAIFGHRAGPGHLF
jgi:hypothetical protein